MYFPKPSLYSCTERKWCASYIHVLKLTPTGNGVRQGGLLCHAIAFPHDAAVASLSSCAKGISDATNGRPLLADGVLSKLRVTFVAPQSMREQLVRSGLSCRHIVARSNVVREIIDTLRQCSPQFSSIDDNVFNTLNFDEIEDLQRQLIEGATLLSE